MPAPKNQPIGDLRLKTFLERAETPVPAPRVNEAEKGEQTAHTYVNAFHEKAGLSQEIFRYRVAAVAILPSAVVVSVSLAASWAFSLQPVLLPDYRPALPSQG